LGKRTTAPTGSSGNAGETALRALFAGVGATGGDWQAAKPSLPLVVGRPADAVNPEALDLDEFRPLASAPSEGRATNPDGGGGV
jgi:hypothetical protein